MPIEYTLDDRGDFALVTAKGDLNLKEAVDYLGSCIQDILKRNVRRVILDNRKLAGKALSFYDSYELASCIEREASLRRIRLALVVPPDRRKSARDLETIVRNRGFSFLGFDSLEEAARWLTNNACADCEKEPLINPEDCANYS